MHSALQLRLPKPRLALSGFSLFLAKVSGLVALWLGLWALLAASTALERPRFHVAGQIHYVGRPATGATVRLFPLDHEPHLTRPAAWGTVASDGTFEVKTLGWAEGAPVGKYAVTVFYEPPVIRGEDCAAGQQLLDAELSDPRTTPLAIEVLPQPNELGLLSLETPRVTGSGDYSPRWSLLSQSHLSPGER